MPYSTEHIALQNPFIDKRSKLLPCQKERIFAMYHETDDWSLNGLAKRFGVSKRTIHFIVKPETLEKAKADFAERQKDGRYYNRLKHNKSVREHRRRKHEIFKDT